jgi:anaerobic selenocysteine-containing dehydrogenase
VEDGRLVAVEPDPGHPTGKNLCVKGRAAPELVYAPDRLLYPLRRTRPKGDPDPGWIRITWDEALDWTATQMREAAARDGVEAVAFAVTTAAGTAVSDGFAWIERLIRLFGSPNTIYAAELCSWHRDFATAYTFGVEPRARRRLRAVRVVAGVRAAGVARLRRDGPRERKLQRPDRHGDG